VTLNIPLVLSAILDEYELPLEGAHGVSHWARVMENGLRLAEETGANEAVSNRLGDQLLALTDWLCPKGNLSLFLDAGQQLLESR
jgi:hypothetical protein